MSENKKIEALYKLSNEFVSKAVKNSFIKEKFQESCKYEDLEKYPITDHDKEEQCPISTEFDELYEWIDNQLLNRKVNYIFIHTTGTEQDVKVSSILKYWKNNLGWKNPGYHIIFPLEGYTVLSDLNDVVNGARNYNHNGIHLSYIGGIDKDGKPLDTRNESQSNLLLLTVEKLLLKFPNAKIKLHNEVSNKACPSFDKETWNKEFGEFLKEKP